MYVCMYVYSDIEKKVVIRAFNLYEWSTTANIVKSNM